MDLRQSSETPSLPVRANPSPQVDVAALTRQLAKGDETAYRVFYNAYYNRLWRYLLVVTRGDEDASREALQGALIRLARYAREFSSEAVFWSWLTKLARSALYDSRRQRGRYRTLLERFTERSRIEQTAPDDGVAESHLVAILDKQLLSLPLEERTLIERKYIEGMAVAAIAQSLDMSDKAVESWLSRIRGKLRRAALEELKRDASA